MSARWTIRVARPTDQLERIARMYGEGLGLTVLATFVDHDGFDGAVLGRRGEAYHLEFTTQRGHVAGRAPTDEHLLVLYIPDRAEWMSTCGSLERAGFRSVPAKNPYWDSAGRTFEDVDGYRVVLQNATWPD
jgi:YycE-like protein